MSENIIMGYIPIDKKVNLLKFWNSIWRTRLCDSWRKNYRKIDIGKINNKFFLGSIVIDDCQNVELKIDDFKVRVGRGNKIIIKNIDFEEEDSKISNPTDGLFEIL